MNIYFLGGAFFENFYNDLIEDSIGNIQNAANVLQLKFLEGLIEQDEVESLAVINLPFIGSYPKFYKKPYFKSNQKNVKFKENIDVYNVNFNNIKIIKNLSRLLNTTINSYGILKKREALDKQTYFIIYSMHLPFLLSSIILKLIFNDIKFYVIIPDLPEYMADRKGIKAFFFNSISKLSYLIVNNLDGAVILTEQMKDKFSQGLPTVVIEGIASNSDFLAINKLSITKKNFFLYGGTLDNRYGIKSLIDSFNKLPITSEVELYICGDGPDRREVLEAIKKNPKIKYMGQLEREKLLILQREARLLVNPRPNDEEYTKYSFPSKTLEYMSSGTPVLMYRLSGVPTDYNDYLYLVEDENSFTNSLLKLSEMEYSYLEEVGRKAQKFVNDFKNPKAQVRKIFTIMR